MSNKGEARWYDAKRNVRIGDDDKILHPKELEERKEQSEYPFNRELGSAEAMLATTLVTWPDSTPLLLEGVPCRWLVVSGTGPGDLRGFTCPDSGNSSPVVAELKVHPDKQAGATLAHLKKALIQAIAGLEQTVWAYCVEGARADGKRPDAQEWLKVKEIQSPAHLLLVADHWNIGEGVFDREFEDKAFGQAFDKAIEEKNKPVKSSKPQFMGKSVYSSAFRAFRLQEVLRDLKLEVHVLGVTRHKDGESRLLRVETLCSKTWSVS